MIPKSVKRFSEKIMLKRKDKAQCRTEMRASGFKPGLTFL